MICTKFIEKLLLKVQYFAHRIQQLENPILFGFFTLLAIRTKKLYEYILVICYFVSFVKINPITYLVKKNHQKGVAISELIVGSGQQDIHCVAKV